jgi:bifunctional non-homologous end joining protein LigD
MKERITVESDGHLLEVSNLDKVLYPADGIVKAEVIRYYLAVAPAMLRHIGGRPVALVRYPDGIVGEQFFHKNRPDWAPDWVPQARLGEEKPIDYVIPDSGAVLAWLANLASLEIHVMNVRQPHLERPDFIAFDLDPAPESPFARTVELALALRQHLEQHGYRPFVKTSGQKGLHVVVPVHPQWDIDTCLQAARELASGFATKHRDLTLQMSKKQRVNKTLIDIYRNARGQTMIAPYSLRGRDGAPVSLPLDWDDLEALESAADFTLHDVPGLLAEHGDAWQDFSEAAAPLHTEATPIVNGAPALNEYERKRHFERTSEPRGNGRAAAGNAFVIQRHHATRLHYDLRLEEDGVLKSWAVPKGLPPRPGIRRLAVQTEDHPLEYLTFEGTIPKGEYGGGEMWVFSQGRYETVKKSRNSLYVRLQDAAEAAEYRLIHTDGDQWFVERTNTPAVDWPRAFVPPMKAALAKEPPADDAWLFEMKWDGIRALISIDEGEIRIRTRNNIDITENFPELTDGGVFRSVSAVLDGEIVCLDDEGRPRFDAVLKRVQGRRGARDFPAHCYLFDCLYLDGRPIVSEPLLRRQTWLADSLKNQDGPYRLSRAIDDGAAFFEAVREKGLEGIMAKRRDSPYRAGDRNADWLKVKVVSTTDCRIIGFTPGEGGTRNSFGALHLAQHADGNLVYRGKVGSGFSERERRELRALLDDLPPLEEDVAGRPSNRNGTWVAPLLTCEIKYNELTRSGVFRAPVYLRLRPDKSDAATVIDSALL